MAGCSGGGSGGGPSSDANPRDLLPDPPDGWTQGDVSQQSAGMVGAEAGYGAGYDDEGGQYYSVEILRWSSQSDAETEGLDVYESGWSVYVVRNNFGFAGKGPDVGKVVTLLGNSSALSQGYVEENDLK